MKIEQALIQSDKVCSIFIRGCDSLNYGRLTDYSSPQTTFWILKSLTNSLQVTPWGLNGDMFVPGD